MLDVLFGTRLWSQDFVSNPFVYVIDDVTRITPQDKASMKRCFADNYKKYQQETQLLSEPRKVIEGKADPASINKLRGL